MTDQARSPSLTVLTILTQTPPSGTRDLAPMTSPALDARTLKIHGFAYRVTSSAWGAAFHLAIGRARGERTTKVHAVTDEPTTHASLHDRLAERRVKGRHSTKRAQRGATPRFIECGNQTEARARLNARRKRRPLNRGLTA